MEQQASRRQEETGPAVLHPDIAEKLYYLTCDDQPTGAGGIRLQRGSRPPLVFVLFVTAKVCAGIDTGVRRVRERAAVFVAKVLYTPRATPRGVGECGKAKVGGVCVCLCVSVGGAEGKHAITARK